MSTLTEKSIPRFGKTLQIPGLENVVKPEKDWQVDLAWRLMPGRQTDVPAPEPVFPQGL